MHGIDAWGVLRFSNEVAALPTVTAAATEGSDPSAMAASAVAKSNQGKASRHKFLLSRFRKLVNRFTKLVNPDVGVARKTRTGKASLVDLVKAKVIAPGVGVISIRGKESETTADLTLEGTIIFNGRTFNSPSAFGKFGLERTRLSGWAYMMYRAEGSSSWRPLVSIREHYADSICSDKSLSTTPLKKRIKLDTDSAGSAKLQKKKAGAKSPKSRKKKAGAKSPKLQKKKAGAKSPKLQKNKASAQSAKSQKNAAKKARKKRTTKADLGSLIEAKVILPGVGVIAARGRETEATADLTPNGTIMFNGVEFNSPSAFAKVALGKSQLNGWLCTMYRYEDSQSWRSLMDIRTKAAISAASTAVTAATQKSSDGDAAEATTCDGVGPQKRRAEAELDNSSADKRSKST